jgi:hypothetical protein
MSWTPETAKWPLVRGRRRPRRRTSARTIGTVASGGRTRQARPAEAEGPVGILGPVSRTIELFAGLTLVVVGIVILGGEWIRSVLVELGVSPELWAWWPLLLIVLSLFFLVPAFFGGQHRRLRAGMVIPGAVLAGVGGALLYTSLTDRWSAWTYLWSVLPFSLGLGMYAAGWIADAPAFKWIGAAVAAGGVLAYLAFATAFGGEAFRLVAAIGIIGLGLALTVGGLAERLSRKSPAA